MVDAFAATQDAESAFITTTGTAGPGSHALFAEILQNDRIDLSARVPEDYCLDITSRQLDQCFQASSWLWQDMLDLPSLADITSSLARNGAISAAEQLRFKHERARFKHLRFAFAVFGSRHRYPMGIDAVTSVMGNLQDAFKNGIRPAIRRNAVLLNVLLRPLPMALVTREIRRFEAASPESLRRYMTRQADAIHAFLRHEQVTAIAFHDTRKMVSRTRAFFVTMQTLFEDPDVAGMADFVACINGLMGNHHDGLMSASLHGTLDYHRDRFELQPAIRERLQMLASALH